MQQYFIPNRKSAFTSITSLCLYGVPTRSLGPARRTPLVGKRAVVGAEDPAALVVCARWPLEAPGLPASFERGVYVPALLPDCHLLSNHKSLLLS